MISFRNGQLQRVLRKFSSCEQSGSVDAIADLNSILNGSYSRAVQEYIAAPKSGMICCVKSDRNWYRGLILIDAVGKTSICKVWRIDMGDIIWTKWSRLRVLRERFAHIPAYSMRCKIPADQLDPFDRSDQKAFIVSVDSDACCSVLLRSPTKLMKQYINSKRTLQMVEVLRVDSLQSFYVELTKDRNGVEKLLEDVQRYACSIDDTTIDHHEWRANDYCVVKVCQQNGSRWYRGQIIDITADGFHVRLRDECDTKVLVKQREFIRPISDSLCDVRDRTIKCRLSGIDDDLGIFNTEAAHQFEIVRSQFQFWAISMHEKPCDQTMPVVLWGGKKSYDADLMTLCEWQNINQILIEQEHAHPDENFEMNISMASDKSTNSSDDESNESVLEYVDDLMQLGVVVDKWLPSKPYHNAPYKATVTYVSQKCVVHVLDDNGRSLAEQMKMKITEYVKLLKSQKTNTKKTAKWIRNLEIGQACFARFTDRKFYRATIRRIYRENEYCVVRFVDYGNVEMCKFNNLYPAEMFLGVPTLSQTYTFADIRPVSMNADCDESGLYRWPKTVQKFCLNHLVFCRCLVCPRDNTDFPNGIQACGLFKRGDRIAFAEHLVNNDMAAFI